MFVTSKDVDNIKESSTASLKERMEFISLVIFTSEDEDRNTIQLSLLK